MSVTAKTLPMLWLILKFEKKKIQVGNNDQVTYLSMHCDIQHFLKLVSVSVHVFMMINNC